MDRCRLLVEGPDDKHVLWALLAAHRIEQTFVVEDLGGVDRLLDNLRVRLVARSDERLGVIVDADERLPDRWRSCLLYTSSASTTTTRSRSSSTT